MKYDYIITITCHAGNNWNGRSTIEELFVTTTPNRLLVLLTALNDSPDVVDISVSRTLTLPPLPRLGKVIRESLNIDNGMLNKIK